MKNLHRLQKNTIKTILNILIRIYSSRVQNIDFEIISIYLCIISVNEFLLCFPVLIIIDYSAGPLIYIVEFTLKDIFIFEVKAGSILVHFFDHFMEFWINSFQNWILSSETKVLTIFFTHWINILFFADQTFLHIGITFWCELN